MNLASSRRRLTCIRRSTESHTSYCNLNTYKKNYFEGFYPPFRTILCMFIVYSWECWFCLSKITRLATATRSYRERQIGEFYETGPYDISEVL